jgi:polyhydroxyalkanoate synthesis regulator protein
VDLFDRKRPIWGERGLAVASGAYMKADTKAVRYYGPQLADFVEKVFEASLKATDAQIKLREQVS